MHKLEQLITMVEKTHHNLGNATAFAIICAKASKCLLIVSPAGCGKSTITNLLYRSQKDSIRLDSVTRSGLRDFTDTFNNYHGVVVIDDMGKIDSKYNRQHTISTFAELCYSHFISKHTFAVTIELADFYGSAILNIQPTILAEIYESPEWEAVIMDKTIRYYHLYRPITPTDGFLDVTIDWGMDFNRVAKPDKRYKLFSKLNDIAGVQWSDARCLEHLNDLLRASAALDNRDTVNNDDMLLLFRLMKPLTVEQAIFNKYGFETGRHMETNLAAVLVEFASWKDVSIGRIARDYKISPSTVYRLLSEIREWFEASEVASKKLVPRPAFKQILKKAGVGK